MNSYEKEVPFQNKRTERVHWVGTRFRGGWQASRYSEARGGVVLLAVSICSELSYLNKNEYINK